jgi:hypothetical protein
LSWRPTCPSAPVSSSVFPYRLTWPASAPSRVRASARVRPVIRHRSAEGRPTSVPVSCCLSAAGIRFSGHPVPAGELGLPHSRLTGHAGVRTLTGLPRFARTSCGRGGCLLYPEGGGAHSADKKSPTDACRSSTASPSTPLRTTHQQGSRITRHQRRFTRFTRPALPSPCPRMERGPSGLNPELRTPPLPAAHVRAGTGHRALTRNYATDR